MDPDGGPFAAIDRFAHLVAGDPAAVPLDQGALALADVLHPRTDIPAALATLDDLGDACPNASFDGLLRFLFRELRFAGRREDYDDPRNSFLDVVLVRRGGLPILLATVLIEVGRRAGVEVVGIGMPMHFLVRDGIDEDAFADPFTGERMDRHGVRRRFDSMARGRLAWDDRYLRPTSARMVLVRILGNLRASYGRRHDMLHLALVARLRAAIPELHAEQAGVARASAVLN